jgi:dolichyl-diphosphooligosaccharide---protein glycosyltransferase
MYKMSYYRFHELYGNQQPVDRVRQQRLPVVGPTLDTLGECFIHIISLTKVYMYIFVTDEAFTSENWIVRIYQVKKDDDLSRSLKNANGFDKGTRKKRKANKQKM